MYIEDKDREILQMWYLKTVHSYSALKYQHLQLSTTTVSMQLLLVRCIIMSSFKDKIADYFYELRQICSVTDLDDSFVSRYVRKN